jgi:hypothetical protein
MIVVLAALVVVVLLLIPLEYVHDVVARDVFRFANWLTHGTPIWMAVAGWFTYGLLPLVAITLDGDKRRRYGRPEISVADDSTQLIRRIRADDGHRIARRPLGYWATRTPLLVVVALAIGFLPLPGRRADLAEMMSATRGGAAFLIGWQWACVAGLLGTMVVIMAPVAGAIRRSPTKHSAIPGYVLALAMSAAGLVVSILSA